MTHALELVDVHTYYGNIHALKGVSLTVDAGEIVTLIGSNGAGKSTTLRTISGTTRAREGKVIFNGAEIQAQRAHEIVGLGIAQAPEGRHVFARMTVFENLLMGAFSRKDHRAIAQDLDRVLTQFPKLAERLSQRAGTLSGGEQQMVAMARALMGRPKLICMDEPTMGLSPLWVDRVLDLIAAINREGTTVFMVEQNASLALEIAHHAYVLQTGRIILDGPAADLRSDPRIRDAYLGGQEAA